MIIKNGIQLTVRNLLPLMRKYNTNKIICNNKTVIFIYENNLTKDNYFMYDPISKIKWNSDGTIKAIRRIFCGIDPNKNTKMLEEIKKNIDWNLYSKKSDYNYFSENQFLLPERILNQFISYNDEVDEYRTIQEPMYMYIDCINLLEESLHEINQGG